MSSTGRWNAIFIAAYASSNTINAFILIPHI
nr:MAG TPA: hypothetical protein [Caudoviricetes sp.]